jgi:hypothetical protein
LALNAADCSAAAADRHHLVGDLAALESCGIAP